MKRFKKFLKAFGISVVVFTGTMLFTCGFLWLHGWLYDYSPYLAFSMDAILIIAMVCGFVYSWMSDGCDEN